MEVLVLGKVIQIVKVAVAAIVVSVVLLFVCAFIAYKLHLGTPQIVLCVAVIYGVGAFVTGFGMGKLKKEKRLLWGVLSGFTYFLIVFVISIGVHSGIGSSVGNIIRNFIICTAAGTIGGILG